MARPLRVQFRGAIYHVMSRGSERRPIVRNDSDRTRWMERLRRTVETYGWRLHAFVLMSNHRGRALLLTTDAVTPILDGWFSRRYATKEMGGGL